MFEQSLVEARGLAARPWSLAASLTMQTALVSVAIVFPLVHPEMLQKVAVWIPVVSPPHGYHRPAVQRAETTRAATTRRVWTTGFFAPAQVPNRVANIVDTLPPEPTGPTFGSEDGVPGGIDSSGDVSPFIPSIAKLPDVPARPPAAAVKPVPKPAAPPAPIRQSSGVQAALLMYGPKPAYPPLCKQARIQGTVHLAAVIGTDGKVIDLRATDGHPLLAAAAVDAVKHWVYRPTLLNREPVEVVTEITVTFTLQ